MFDANKTKTDIVRWIAGWFRDNGLPETKAVVGISGGKDSTVVAALCCEALGKERVVGVMLPQGVQDDIDVSYDVCKTLGIPYMEINIGAATQALYDGITQGGGELCVIGKTGEADGQASRITQSAPPPCVMLNTPARIRMTALYAVSAAVGGRVANTSNLSEDYVGYATKFGDSAGDFSPLSNLTVTEVKAVGRALGLPSRFVDKTPIDGLSGKADEENLGFSYAVLDRYIREGVCGDAGVKERIDKLHKMNLHKVSPMPAFRLANRE
ncbi:MAG: NAD(+) synthase [Firmicutes bacterium]|nr:NAD(+) synthase [Bacillota bacterium]